MIKVLYTPAVLDLALEWLIENVDANSKDDKRHSCTSFIFRKTAWYSYKRIWYVKYFEQANTLEINCFDPINEQKLADLLK